MSAVLAKAKSKKRDKAPADTRAKPHAERIPSQPTRPTNIQAKAYYAAPPVQLLNFPIQTKVAIGRPNDPYEREADAVADRVVAGRTVGSITTLPPGGLGAVAQRQEEAEDETAQPAPLQCQEKEEGVEAAQRATLQRQEEEPEDAAQTAPLQRQEDEETGAAAQPSLLQRQEEADAEEEAPGEETTGEPVQSQLIQRQTEDAEEEADEEESIQPQLLQRQEDTAEDTAQTLSIQRQGEGDAEEPAQPEMVQRQADEGTEETTQTALVQCQEEEDAQTAALQRQEEEGAGEDVQEMSVQFESQEDAVQERHAGSPVPPATQGMRTAAAQAIHARGPGEPMNLQTRQKIEASQGADLSEVRVHEDSSAQQAAGALKAKAFTHKNHIWLGQGQSQTNVRLMAHETTHVLQQGGVVRRKPLEDTEEESRPEGEEDIRTPETLEEDKGAAPEPVAAPPLEKSIEAIPLTKTMLPESSEALPGVGGITSKTAESVKAITPSEKKAEVDEKAVGSKAETIEKNGATEEKTTETSELLADKEEKAGAIEPAVVETAAPKEEIKAGDATLTGPKEAVPPKGEAGAVDIGEKAAGPAPATEAEAVVPEPETDPRFKQTQARLVKLAKKERRHGPAGRKVTSAELATEQPKNEPISKGMIVSVDDMSQQSELSEKQDKPKEESFLKMLEEALERITPKTPKDVENLGEKGVGGDKLRRAVKSNVSNQTAQSTKAVAVSAKNDPQETGFETPVPLPKDKKEGAPARVGAENVLPEPKPDTEISMESDKNTADDELAKTGLTEEQLTKANEPSFDDAVNAKKEVHENSDVAPQRYRKAETDYLESSNKEAKKEEKKARYQMRFVRNAKKKKTIDKQNDLMSNRASDRKRIADDIGKIYKKTRGSVLLKLKGLESQVDTIFDDGHKTAFDTMKKNVARRLRDWKWKRYGRRALIPIVGGLIAAGTWAYDKIRGIDRIRDVRDIYFSERKLYKDRMKVVFRKIADKVETTLKECKNEIKHGKDSVKEFVSKLDTGLKGLGRKAAKDIDAQFDSLEQEVNDKKRELAERMARRYNESRKEVDKWIEKERNKNKGLIDKLIGFVRKVIETLKKLKALLDSALRKVKAAIKLIIADPIQFLKNILSAVIKGFSQFVGNIFTHLKTGLMSWLFGTLGKANIDMPKDFSLKSIFALVLQIFGITKENIRAKLVRLIGPRAVAVMEKAWDYISVLIREGPSGLWAKIKESIGNLKEMVIEKVKEYVIGEIIKAAVKKLAMMFNPVGAFIQAAITIYNVVMFFVEQIERILQLVNTIMDSVLSIAKGQIDAAANWIEKTLARTVPIIISFLARLLGLGGLSEKVRRIVDKVRKPVNRAIDKFLAKVAAKFKKLFRKGKVAAKKAAKKLKELFFPKKHFKVGAESHSVEAKKSGKRHIIVVRSNTMTIPKVIAEARKDPTLKTNNTFQKNKVDKLESDYSKWPRMKTNTPKLRQDKSDKYLEIYNLTVTIMKKLSIMTKSLARVSNIKWSKDSSGRPKKVEADPLTAKGPVGGTPGDKIPGWRTDYVESEYRLHLLHHKLHGPGRAFNLVPGSKKMNELMRNVEIPTLAALGIKKKNLNKQKNIELKYTVTVGYGTPPVPLEKTVAKNVKINDVKGKNLSTNTKISIPGVKTPDNF